MKRMSTIDCFFAKKPKNVEIEPDEVGSDVKTGHFYLRII
jgi:hypothetical protein